MRYKTTYNLLVRLVTQVDIHQKWNKNKHKSALTKSELILGQQWNIII